MADNKYQKVFRLQTRSCKAFQQLETNSLEQDSCATENTITHAGKYVTQASGNEKILSYNRLTYFLSIVVEWEWFKKYDVEERRQRRHR